MATYIRIMRATSGWLHATSKRCHYLCKRKRCNCSCEQQEEGSYCRNIWYCLLNKYKSVSRIGTLLCDHAFWVTAPFFKNPWLGLPLPSRTISINASIANSSVILSVYEGGGLATAHAVSEKPVRVRVIRPNARLRKWPTLAYCNVEWPTARVVEWALKWIINQWKPFTEYWWYKRSLKIL